MVVDLTGRNDEVSELATLPRDVLGDPEARTTTVQPRLLGPAAAAALQASKRKLPESFRKPPVPKRKPAAVDPRPASLVAVQSKAPTPTRIAASESSLTLQDSHKLHQQKQQAAASPVNTSSQPSLQHTSDELGPQIPSTNVVDLSSLQPAASQQPKAPRRLPGSLAVPVSVPSDLKSSGIRNAAASVSKSGPSEHDTKAALRAALEGLQMSGGVELNVPAGRMATPLMRHQRLALAWMLQRERLTSNPRGGILADDQGLGKTVSTIALIVTNQPGDDVAEEAFANMDAQSQKLQAVNGSHASAAGAHAQSASEQVDQNVAMPESESGTAAAATAAAEDTSLAGVAEARSSEQCNELVDADTNPVAHGAMQPAPMTDAHNGHSQHLNGSTISSDVRQHADLQQPAQLNGHSIQPNGNRKRAETAEIDVSHEQEHDSDNVAGLPEGGTLIVCPTAVLNQWARELEAKVAKGAGMTVYMYHGKGRDVKPQQLARYNCVLTTYTSMSMEAAPKANAKQATNPLQAIELHEDQEELKPSDGKGKKKAAGPLFQIHWWRVVLDEAQSIKNASTLMAHAAHALQAGRRWCLSGTPIQNGVDDLYSIFRFLRYNPYCKREAFKAMLKEPLQEDPAKGAQRLQICLKPVLLRRTKTSKIDGEPVVVLPPRQQQLIRKSFSASEQKFYDQVQQESMQKLKALEEGGSGSSYVNMLWLLLRLRQACNHPWLVQGTSAKYGGPGACTSPVATGNNSTAKVSASQLTAAKKLAGPLVEQLLQTLEQQPSICAQCEDISEDSVVSACHHVFCRQCIIMQVGSLGGASEKDSYFQCPACAMPLTAAQVFTAAALKKARGQQEGSGKAGGGSSKGGQQGSWHSSAKVEQLLELLRAMQHRGATGKPPSSGRGNSISSSAFGGRSQSDMRLAAVLGGPSRSPSPSPSKVATQEKVIIFSQWTSMLDLIEMALKKEKFVFRRLDGGMSMANRDQAIVDFQEQAGVNVLIVSLKAAALGLNLVAANHVVLMDLWWNPTVEEQAIDRAHRIGQTRTVHVTRITIAGTVEERILELQERKRSIISAAFGEGAGGSQQATRLTKEDLHFLFTGQS